MRRLDVAPSDMNRNHFCIPALLGALLLPAPLLAEVCLYRDSEGRVTYSNVTEAPPKGAKKIRCFEEAQAAPARPAPAAKAPARGDGFPKVDRDTQRKRDDDRRRVLEQELDAEKQQLDAAQKSLAEQESVRYGEERNYQRFLDRVQPYRDAVANHERNIEAIQQELANTR